MLLRKRVWDIMREDFAFVREDSSLADAITALRAIRVKQPDMSFIRSATLDVKAHLRPGVLVILEVSD